MDIRCLTGDATRPVGRGNKIIAHVRNEQGRWVKRVVMATEPAGAGPMRRTGSSSSRQLAPNQIVAA